MTDIDMVLACIRTLGFVREEPPGSNNGQAVKAIQAITGNKPPDPWCASTVAYVGVKALGKRWPLPLTGSVQSLFHAAETKGLIRDTPQVGDIFCIWYASMNRFAHTGLVEMVNADGSCETWEGNAADPSKPASREGFGLFRRTRKFGKKDKFIRWSEGL